MNGNYYLIQLTCQNPIFQSELDKPLYKARFDLLLHSFTSEAERARLLSVSSESTTDWLHAILNPSLGLHLDPMQVHIACGLRLGATLCHPHECNCGEMVESNGRHGLKCKHAVGRKTRHEEVNKLLKLGLDQAKSPSTLEPIGISRRLNLYYLEKRKMLNLGLHLCGHFVQVICQERI